MIPRFLSSAHLVCYSFSVTFIQMESKPNYSQLEHIINTDDTTAITINEFNPLRKNINGIRKSVHLLEI